MGLSLNIFTLLLIILLNSPLSAHPHSFIEVYPTLKSSSVNSSTIHFKWRLDDMTSSMLILDIDQNGNGKIDTKENNFIRKNYFSIFEQFNYYTYIKSKEGDVKFPKVKNFQATIQDNRVCYSFEITVTYNIQELTFEFGDSDFYIAMILKKEFINMQGYRSKVTGVDNDYYYGYKMEIQE